jgi:hypothetical protein
MSALGAAVLGVVSLCNLLNLSGTYTLQLTLVD